ncbi:glyoxalase [Pseudoroseomonas rhizosphaerae]|uniref:Glyoxalase n=1 Tax=Teichococcus rhizosphaerae TaxID=1335062 RepID=A0A2C7AGX8_9PROT|nr:VOC family protein [Pseudoroseomonas rhizosphaerae]PHK96745.1 glyoxalase [Pseudoroseomonas rhizosphaerae]
MTALRPAAPGKLLETALYVRDLHATRWFYEHILGLECLQATESFCALGIGPGVLLLFRRGTAAADTEVPGGRIPGHDAGGRQHIALQVAENTLPGWSEWLGLNTITVEGRVSWPKGGHSLFLRDPEGHLVELATPGLWPGNR